MNPPVPSPVQSPIKDARILIVDDQEMNTALLEGLLEDEGYRRVKSTNDSRQTLELVQSFSPDLLLLDLRMPHLDGFAVMDQLAPLLAAPNFLPVIVLTADVTPEARIQSLSGGAQDFLTKPFEPLEVLLRVRNLLETRFLHLRLKRQNDRLEQRVLERTQALEHAMDSLLERTQALEEAHTEMATRLAIVGEYRDDDTGEHTWRVGNTSAKLAEALGMGRQEAGLLLRAARLHDVGKVGIPDDILLKPGKLTLEEFDLMKAHTTIGASILAGGRSQILLLAEEIALTHHERWDGTGYPHGLVGEAIPLSSRIVAVADVFDALISERPYKKAWSSVEAIAEIERQSGRQFDPRVVTAFVQISG